MIPSKADVTSTLTGLETRKFSIQVNAKSFKVLLDGLYTDKPQSIIRELWTNAFDSHVAAGIADQPFHCQLPTSLLPMFSVRDYGTSMDHETVMDTYTRVFDSTKTGSNEQTGMLGLGSKSPFAYTDAFTAIAYSGTEKRVYAAAMDEDGIPEIALLKTEPCGEPRGFEVSFGVQEAHIRQFHNAATRVIIGFDVPPTLSGAEIEPPTPIFEAEDFKVMKSNDYISRGEGGYVRQGPVVYPIPYELRWSLSDEARFILKDEYFYIIDVPIGSVEFTASREALQLTDETKTYVADKINNAISVLVNTAEEDVLSQPSYMRAYRAFNGWGAFMMMKDVQVHGRTIYANKVGHIPILANGPMPRFYKAGGRGITQVLPTSRGEYFFKIDDLDKLEFVIDSPAMKVPRKRKRYLEYADGKQNCFWLDDPSPGAIIRLMRLLELQPDQFKKVGDLPDVDLPPRTNTGTASGIYLVEWAGNGYPFNSKPAELDDSKNYLWVDIERAYASELIMLPKIFSSSRFDQRGDMATRWISLLNKYSDTTYDGVAVLTPRAQKKYNLAPEDRLDAKVFECIEGMQDTIAKMLEIPTDSEFGYNRWGILILRELREGFDDWDQNLLRIASSHNMPRAFPQFQKAMEKRGDAAREIQERYPMIFDATEQATREYIELMNELHEAKKESEV